MTLNRESRENRVRTRRRDVLPTTFYMPLGTAREGEGARDQPEDLPGQAVVKFVCIVR